MFNVGDRVVITEAYNDPEVEGLSGTVTKINRVCFPVEVNLDVVEGVTDNEIWRTALFELEELRHADR